MNRVTFVLIENYVKRLILFEGIFDRRANWGGFDDYLRNIFCKDRFDFNVECFRIFLKSLRLIVCCKGLFRVYELQRILEYRLKNILFEGWLDLDTRFFLNS